MKPLRLWKTGSDRRSIRSLRACIALSLAVLLLCGCGSTSMSGSAGAGQADSAGAEAAELTCQPAELISGVETREKIVSLVLEGSVDDTILYGILDVLKEHSIPATFFVSGTMVDEQPEIVRKIAAEGFDIGNYGMSGASMMEKNTPQQNVYQFEKTQKMIFQNCLAVPALARANGTDYTREVLQAVTAAGLDAAVNPDFYVNHKSFQSLADARYLVNSLMCGSLISVKLGQELTLEELGAEGRKWDEKPAIDPPPSIAEDGMSQLEENPYENLKQSVLWLLECLDEKGYTVVSLRELKAAEESFLGEGTELSGEVQALADYNRYSVPVTQEPLAIGAQGNASSAELEGTVIVGDSVTESLSSYIRWKREKEPEYLHGVEFLTADNATVERLLSDALFTPEVPQEDPEADPAGALLRVEDALAAMGAKRICLMVRSGNSRAYTGEKFMKNYRMLIANIREKNPDAEIIVQSLPPVMPGSGTPNSGNLFRLNLMLYSLCARYGISFVDSAFALRDAAGELRPEFCLDGATYGKHLNADGCEAWIEFFTTHFPQA